MASDSEPIKFFSRPPRGPLRSHISGNKKPVRLLVTQLELKLANSNSSSCRTTQSTVLVVFSDDTCREGLLPQYADDQATPRIHAWQAVFCQPSSIYLS